MAIPDYQAVMLPLLSFAADGREHRNREAYRVLADQFQLTDRERKKLLPSGIVIFTSRVSWARTYLKKAQLVVCPKSGYFQITDRGKTVLAQKPTAIDVNFLQQFPEFREYYPAKRKKNSS